MKQLTFDGKGILVVPGHELASGESAEISDKLAEEIVAGNPGLPVTIADLPAKSGSTRSGSSISQEAQPEAHEGEGQPPASNEEKE